MTHPTGTELASHADGSLPSLDAARVQRHLDGCLECATTFRAMHDVVTRMKKTPAFKPDFDALEKQPPSRVAHVLAAALCAGAAFLVVMQRERENGIVARGEAAREAVMLHVAVEQGGKRVDLVENSRLGTAPLRTFVTLEVTDPGDAHFFGVFLRDAGGDVRWLYPAWTDPARPPVLVSVEKPGVHVAPDALALPGLVEGPLELGLVAASSPCAVDALDAPLSRRETPSCAKSVRIARMAVDGSAR